MKHTLEFTGFAIFSLICATLFASPAPADEPTPDLQSTPGDPIPMPKNYWDPKNTTGVIAFTVDGIIQSFVFLSVDGKRMVLSAEATAKNERAHTLLMAVMEAGHLDNVSYDSGCTNIEDEKKLEKKANAYRSAPDSLQQAPSVPK